MCIVAKKNMYRCKTMSCKCMKLTGTVLCITCHISHVAYWLPSESTQQELSNEYQYDKLRRYSKISLCVLVLWMEEAPALGGLKS